MEGLIVLGLVVVGLVLFDMLALRFGVDSRIGSLDPRAQETGLTV